MTAALSRLLNGAGVDADQWRALTIASLKLDYRQTAVGTSPAQPAARGASAFAMVAVFYTVFGVFMAVAIAFTRDAWLAGTIVMTAIMFITGTAVLLDHNSAITSPADYGVLGFRPITSRTYFAVRLTNVLVYTSALTTIVGWLPAGEMFLKYGALGGAAGFVALYACSTATTLAVIGVYAAMFRLIGPGMLTRVLSYVQFAMSFLVYGGYFLLSQFMSGSVMDDIALPRTPWTHLYPPTWFASYVVVAIGQGGAADFVAVAASLAAIAAMTATLAGRLSLDYSARLGALAAKAAAAPARVRFRRAWWFGSGEARAIAMLVRTQYRNDLKFRMGVLGILPLTLLYIVMAVRDGSIGDPFVPQYRFSLLTIAVLMFPQMLKMQLTRSEAYRASWIFFACPADRAALLRAGTNVLVAYFLVPYLLFIAAVYVYFVHNVWHVLVHVTLMGLISLLTLQIFVLIEPEVPFSRPPQAVRNSLVVPLMMVMSIAGGVAQIVATLLYQSGVATVVGFAAVAVGSVAVDRLTSARVARQLSSLEFEG